MAKKLSEAEWAKVRYDRENKGLSFHDLAEKYNVSSATVYRKSKADHWKVPVLDDDQVNETNETKNETDSETVKPVKGKGVKPDCLSENETVKPKRNETKRNETANETDQNSKDFDIKGYVDSLKNTFDPTRPRDNKNLAIQLSQIDEHLGDLSKAFDGCGFNGKYRPEFARIAYHIALLGGTPESLANTLKVSEQTIYNWLNTYPEFAIAWYGGTDFADANVVKAMYKRSVGYTEQVEESRTDKDGNVLVSEKVIVFAPDVQAGMFWLTNRQPHNWKHNVEVREEVTVAIVDHEEANARYNSILDKASSLKASLHSRGSRLGLTLDGESEEVE